MKFTKLFILLTLLNFCEIYSQEKVIVKYENGNIKFEGYAQKNVLDSIYREYYENGKVKAEVRLLAVWKKDAPSPTLVTNLVRLSRGEMIGVKFNKDKDWVGGTVGMFEK